MTSMIIRLLSIVLFIRITWWCWWSFHSATTSDNFTISSAASIISIAISRTITIIVTLPVLSHFYQ